MVQQEVGLCSIEFNEAKYMATNTTNIYLHKLITNMTSEMLEYIVVHYDNQSCIKLSTDAIFHDFSKHTDTRYQFL